MISGECTDTILQDWFISVRLNKCLVLVCDQIDLPKILDRFARKVPMLQPIIVLTHLAEEIECHRLDELVRQNMR
jgi:hypothetical protein